MRLVSDILLAILKMCDDEEDLEKIREAKRAEVRRKILLLGKLSKMYGDIQVERIAAVKLKGLTKDGSATMTPALLRAATDGDIIGNFAKARQMDKENERMPSPRRKSADIHALSSTM